MLTGCLFLESRFELFEDFFGPVKDGFWHAGEFCDVYAVTFVGSAGQNLVQKDHFVHPFPDGYVAVFDIREQFCQFCQLVVMCGEEGAAF